jgi:hypothetical protein
MEICSVNVILSWIIIQTPITRHDHNRTVRIDGNDTRWTTYQQNRNPRIHHWLDDAIKDY